MTSKGQASRDSNGRVTEGPATRDLPVLHSYTNESGQLLVVVLAGQRLNISLV